MNPRKIGVLILSLTLMAGFLTACSSKPYTDACAIVVGAGVGDVRKIKDIVHPGQKVSVKGDDEAFYLPCNARNFLVNKNGSGDRQDPAEVTTGNGGVEGAIGLPIKIWPSMYWMLNQDDRVLNEFYPFCRKYQCAGRDESGGDQNANNATQGWNDMLQENHSPVIDRSFSRAAQEFGPDIWVQRSLWPDLAERASEYFWEEMSTNTGTATHFFCGTWTPTVEDQSKGKCSPVTFTINDIQPADGGVKDSYNAQNKAQIDSQNRIKELERQRNEVDAERRLAEDRAKLFDIPGYRDQLAYERELARLEACGRAGLKVCGSGAGVMINAG